MIVSIHQPNYLPYLGFFYKMMQSDIFVIYDDAQFNKEDFQHRNKIKIFHGWKWLTVPVEKKPIPINEIMIRNEPTTKRVMWQSAHFRDIRDNYKETPYFQTYERELDAIYMNKYQRLIDLNMDLINFLICAFDIKSKIVFSSELGFSSKSTERLVDIVDALDGDIYLSGPAGGDYLDSTLFENKGIKVEFQNYSHPFYPQRYLGFIPNMSAIDVLFNVGKIPL